MRKTNPLTKLRFKPQVSAAVGSMSIWIYAYRVYPVVLVFVARKRSLIEEFPQILSNPHRMIVDLENAQVFARLLGLGSYVKAFEETLSFRQAENRETSSSVAPLTSCVTSLRKSMCVCRSSPAFLSLTSARRACVARQRSAKK
jgi:hypothetical protein